jgi:hypothetical protein
MRCPECQYELTESEKLLCLIPDGHYCPQCWARIDPPPGSQQGEGKDAKSGLVNRPDKSGAR